MFRAPTKVTIENNSERDQKLERRNAPYVRTLPQDPLKAGAKDELLSDSPYEEADAGGLTYSSCQFGWSKVRKLKTDPYAFKETAHPPEKCIAKRIIGNPFTGEYEVKFTFK